MNIACYYYIMGWCQGGNRKASKGRVGGASRIAPHCFVTLISKALFISFEKTLVSLFSIRHLFLSFQIVLKMEEAAPQALMCLLSVNDPCHLKRVSSHVSRITNEVHK